MLTQICNTLKYLHLSILIESLRINNLHRFSALGTVADFRNKIFVYQPPRPQELNI